MREFLNSILAVINSEFLTDDEYNSMNLPSPGYDNETYLALDVVLTGRDSVSDSRTRLKNYFLAKGVSVSDVPTGFTNIFIGAPL